jgi:replicative DNA helicase|tara:strand:+ start:663 stop:2027 length:1365 start_codon:yes stop_codon:yes gene_type:complete
MNLSIRQVYFKGDYMKKIEDVLVKVMPQNVEAEEAVLGSVLIGGDVEMQIAMGWIREDDAFYSEKCRNIFICMKELYNNKIPIDVITLSNKVQETFGMQDSLYIMDLQDNVVTKSKVEHYSKIVWERYIQRETAKSAQDLLNASYENYNEVGNIIEKHSRLIDELRHIQPTRARDISDIVDETNQSLQEDSNTIQFGLGRLDNFAGGMTRKEITVLGGRPGHGKTTLMLNVVRGLIEQGYSVMLFNREMSNIETMKKLYVMESNDISYSMIRSGISEDKKIALNSVSEYVKEKYEKLTAFDDIRSLDDCIREINKGKPDVVIDDYIQLIDVGQGYKDRRFEIEKIVQDYKWAVKQNNCSAILVSQLNRDIEKRFDPRPRMSDYAESGVIEQTAESAMFVFYGYNFDSEKYNRYKSEVIVAKSRYGQIGTYPMGFNGNKCKFYNDYKEAEKDTVA